MSITPQDIKADRSAGTLTIIWSADRTSQYAFRTLRGECNCAACVDENTGVRILDRNAIPLDITVKNMQLVGNYAVRIHWSDDHNTGLYTWDHLYQLGAPA
ncbi:MAG: DUF971 domain-containing protein [Planctomycetota bacterium]|nr:DUF971 domain-containing protein [Planctomycetota bacterium]